MYKNELIHTTIYMSFIPPTYKIKGVYWSRTSVGRAGCWSFGEILCLKLLPQSLIDGDSYS